MPIRNIISQEASTCTGTTKKLFASSDSNARREGAQIHNCDTSSDMWVHVVPARAAVPVIAQTLKSWAIPAGSTLQLNVDTSVDIYVASSTGTINYVALEVG